VTVLVRGDQDWNETVVGEGGTARSAHLAGFTIPVSRLIGSVG
jgi:hypothetical protein